jgi:hypothetical protein
MLKIRRQNKKQCLHFSFYSPSPSLSLSFSLFTTLSLLLLSPLSSLPLSLSPLSLYIYITFFPSPLLTRSINIFRLSFSPVSPLSPLPPADCAAVAGRAVPS